MNLVGSGDHFAVAIVDFELRRRDFRVIFLVLEAHGALDFSGRINKCAQRIAGQRVIVTARVHVLKSAVCMIVAFCIRTFEEETFNFVRSVERVALLLVEIVGVTLQDSANVGGVRRAVLVDHVAEDKDLAGSKYIGGRPIKSAPIHSQAQVAFALRGEAADGGTVKGEVVPATDEKLLVVIEHVQAAFEVGEQHRDRLDALFVGQILEAVFLNLVRRYAVLALLLGLQVQLLQLFIRKSEEIAQIVRHGTPSKEI